MFKMFNVKGDVPPQQSPEVQYESSRLKKTRKWEYGVIDSARQSSADLTSPPPKSINELEGLKELKAKAKFHPEPHYPQGLEVILRRIDPRRDSVPKVTRSDETTKKIIENADWIQKKLQDSMYPIASKLGQEYLQGINLLIRLSIDECDKGYRKPNDVNNGDKPDKRSTEEILRELTFYSRTGDAIEEWRKFIEGEGVKPPLAKTLALVREQTNMRVETIDDRLNNSLAFYEIPTVQQSAEENAIRSVLDNLYKLRPRLDEARSAANREARVLLKSIESLLYVMDPP